MSDVEPIIFLKETNGTVSLIDRWPEKTEITHNLISGSPYIEMDGDYISITLPHASALYHKVEETEGGWFCDLKSGSIGHSPSVIAAS